MSGILLAACAEPSKSSNTLMQGYVAETSKSNDTSDDKGCTCMYLMLVCLHLAL